MLVYDMSDYLEFQVSHHPWDTGEDSQVRTPPPPPQPEVEAAGRGRSCQIGDGASWLSNKEPRWKSTWNSNASYLALLFQEALSYETLHT